MPKTSPTKPGTRKLSEVTRHLVLPSGIHSSGYPAVAKQCRKMGVVHDDWQQGLGRAILAKRENGIYAAGIGGIVLSTCRQVGKTYTFGTIIFALCILNPGVTVLWTAHHTRTSDETFEALVGISRRSQIDPYIAKRLSGNGKQSIRFGNGSRILFGAREQGFGRGIPGVAIVVFDEAQILSQKALNDMVPAANTVRNPLIFYMGTPPTPEDRSEVFKSRRRSMLTIERARAAGEEAVSNTLYVEIGADPGADLNDRKQWAKGNPSYPARTPAESIQRLREQLDDDASFRREGLGIWDDDSVGSRLVTGDEWDATAVDTAPAGGLRGFGVAFSEDGTRVALAGAVKHDRGVYVELIDAHTGGFESGVGPLADWLAERWHDTAWIVISGRAGAAALHAALRERGVISRAIHVASTPEYFAACSTTYDGIRARTITHPAGGAGDVLDASIAISDKKQRTVDGAWGWKPTVPDGDETPVEAISLANWGVRTTKRRPGRKQRVRVMS